MALHLHLDSLSRIPIKKAPLRLGFVIRVDDEFDERQARRPRSDVHVIVEPAIRNIWLADGDQGT